MLFTEQIILDAVLKHGKAAESIYSRGHCRILKKKDLNQPYLWLQFLHFPLNRIELTVSELLDWQETKLI